MRALLRIPGTETNILLSWPVALWFHRAYRVKFDAAIPYNALSLRRLLSKQECVNRVIVSDVTCTQALWRIVPSDLKVDTAYGPWDYSAVLVANPDPGELYTVSVKQALKLNIPNSLLLLRPSLFVEDVPTENRLVVLPGYSSRYIRLINTVVNLARPLFDSIYLLGTEDELIYQRGIDLEQIVVRDWYDGALELKRSRFFLAPEGTGAYLANALKVRGVCIHTHSYRDTSLPWYITGEGLFSAELKDLSTFEELVDDILDLFKEEDNAAESTAGDTEVSGETRS